MVCALTLAGCRGPADPPYVDDVALNAEQVALEVGESDTVRAVPVDRSERALSDRSHRVEFRVIDPSVARVENLGEGRAEVTGLELGATDVEAFLGRGSGSVRIYVQPSGLASIDIEPDNLLMGGMHGRFATVHAHLFDDQGVEIDPAGFVIFWSTGDPEIARIEGHRNDPSTTVRALMEGETTVILRVGDLTTSIVVSIPEF